MASDVRHGQGFLYSREGGKCTWSIPLRPPSQHPSVAFTSEVHLRCDSFFFFFCLFSLIRGLHRFHLLLVLAPKTRCRENRV
ncbi:uncharacterized protein BO66DRAFT_227275 [Aspergillus aculeatinus CBS 121060]|uniref:Uncharacterized protein n=1 Tax=Aspergillus aculeatinus CBS 121060 TaxID=1448322 RepID=A0ACD1GUG1_9EURO|nr:hypothetical protein BO66DRAFT_227275 [Aspergillus aculeatinus CBS 121060]RAH64955.1 hypothetical protein BO66DRAFT_227275 [Aspergillus aculeatinus CBS 121060]